MSGNDKPSQPGLGDAAGGSLTALEPCLRDPALSEHDREHRFYRFWGPRVNADEVSSEDLRWIMRFYDRWPAATGSIIGALCARAVIDQGDMAWLSERLKEGSWAQHQLQGIATLREPELPWQSKLSHTLALRADWAAAAILRRAPRHELPEAAEIVVGAGRPRRATRALMAVIASREIPDDWGIVAERLAGVARLEGSSDDRARLSLLRLLDDRSERVRERVLEALPQSDRVLARFAARSCLQDPSALVRCSASEVLGQVGNATDAARLGRALQDPEWIVRAAAGALGDLGSVRARRLLLDALDDGHPNVRGYAAVALARLGNGGAAAKLERALDRERDDNARSGILSGLYLLQGRLWLPPLLALLQNGDPMVRCQALDALSHEIHEPDRPAVCIALAELLAAETHPEARARSERLLQALEQRDGAERSPPGGGLRD